MSIHKSIAELIGQTPLLELVNYEREHSLEATLVAKVEMVNPAGSIKDRVALAMIQDAEERGLIDDQTVFIEPTSGNTGIGLAALAAARGNRMIITMPELATSIDNSIIPGQFTNPANPAAHEATTGPEIWEATNGTVDIFVAGVGTGGTLTGAGRYLKSKNPDIQVVAVEPQGSPVLSQGHAGSHGLQGIGAGFVPATLDTTVYDEVITIENEEAYEAGRELASKEGLLVGISSGAAVAAARKIAERSENAGKLIVVILPDSGERYLSTEMFNFL